MTRDQKERRLATTILHELETVPTIAAQMRVLGRVLDETVQRARKLSRTRLLRQQAKGTRGLAARTRMLRARAQKAARTRMLRTRAQKAARTRARKRRA